MNKFIKIGLAVIIVSILANMMFRGGADKDIDLPTLVKKGALVIVPSSAVDTMNLGGLMGTTSLGATGELLDNTTKGS